VEDAQQHKRDLNSSFANDVLAMESPSIMLPLKASASDALSFDGDTHRSTPRLSSHAQHSGQSSHNMRGVFLHIMADTLGSVGVIISTLLIQLYGWTGFDPIASLFIAVLIVASVVPLIQDAGQVLALDMGPAETTVQRALGDLAAINGVSSHSMSRFWPKDSNTVVGSIHIQVSSVWLSEMNGHLAEVIEEVDQLLRQRLLGLEELTIQVEYV